MDRDARRCRVTRAGAVVRRSAPRGPDARARQRFRHAPMVAAHRGQGRRARRDGTRVRAASVSTGEWRDHELVFVWQHHDLFQSAGAPFAQRHRCPLVSFVDAPQVWEASRWGVARPGWGHLVERYGEAPQLRRATSSRAYPTRSPARCVRFGVGAERIVVSPTAVDAEQFTADGRTAPSVRRPRSRQRVRRRLGGYVPPVPGTRDGGGELRSLPPRRTTRRGSCSSATVRSAQHIEALVRRRRASATAVVFTGAVGPRDVPASPRRDGRRGRLGAFQTTGSTTRRSSCASTWRADAPMLAPRIGEIPGFVDRRSARSSCTRLVTRTTSPSSCGELRDRSGSRARLGAAGRELVLATATWDVRLGRARRLRALSAPRSSEGQARRSRACDASSLSCTRFTPSPSAASTTADVAHEPDHARGLHRRGLVASPHRSVERHVALHEARAEGDRGDGGLQPDLVARVADRAAELLPQRRDHPQVQLVGPARIGARAVGEHQAISR